MQTEVRGKNQPEMLLNRFVDVDSNDTPEKS
jgi:hypothetical protein